MKETGLTHGPFYNHFTSKDDLITKCLEVASKSALADIDNAGATKEGMVAYLEGYLGETHRDHPEQGCLMAALAAEIGRAQGSDDVRSTLTVHLNSVLQRLERLLPWRSRRLARGESVRLMSAMVGALVLARAVNDPALSEEILAEVRDSLP